MTSLPTIPDIPDDIMKAAYAALDAGWNMPRDVANAILAERLRCIAILRGWVELFGDIEIKHTSAREYARGAIEDAIELIASGEQEASQ